MAESREERLARIQAAVDGVTDWMGVGIGNYRVPQEVTLADVHWLLSQVSGEREYRVEARALSLDGEPASEWGGVRPTGGIRLEV